MNRQHRKPADGHGPRHIGSKEKIIYPAAVTCAMGIGTLALGIVFFARDVHHASPSRIGFLAATWSLCYILGCIVLRPLASRLPPRHSILLAAAAMSVSVALILQVDGLSAVFVCYAVYGAATSFFWPPLMGWLSTGLEGPRLNRTMGRFNLCWSSGSIAGPVIAGFLARYDSRFPVAAAAVLYLITALYILTALWQLAGLDAEDGAHRTAAGRDLDQKSIPDGTPVRFPAWAGLFASYIVLGLIINVFPLAAADHLGLSKPVVGLLLFGRALATSLALLGFGKTTRWHYRGSQLVAGLSGFAVVVLFLPTAASPYTIAPLMVLIGILAAQSYANSLFHGVSGSRDRAGRMAIHESLLSAGLICGGAVGGVVYQYAGYGKACQVAGGVLAVIAGGAALMLVKCAETRTVATEVR